MKAAEFWKGRLIPYLNREVCLYIASVHPEGSIKTPMYLAKESVADFWIRKKENCSDKEMTVWFLKFPKEFLTEDMKEDICVTWQALRHAPEIFVGSEEAKKYLLRHPNDALQLPEYQTPGILLLDGVRLDSKTVEMIKNEKFREKVKLALNIQ